MKPLLSLVFLVVICLPGIVSADTAAVAGRWLTQEGDGWIRIALVGDSLQGSIAGATAG